MGLEQILIWQNLRQTTKYGRLTKLQHYPYVPRKSEIESKTEGKRKDITPPWSQRRLLLVVGVLWWWVHAKELDFRVAQAWVLGSFPQVKHTLANMR